VESDNLFSELVQVLTKSASAVDILTFHLSDGAQQRLDGLLTKRREGGLAPSELAELDVFEQFEHLIRLVKARLRNKHPKI
jgi:hypothetical protein